MKKKLMNVLKVMRLKRFWLMVAVLISLITYVLGYTDSIDIPGEGSVTVNRATKTAGILVSIAVAYLTGRKTEKEKKQEKDK